MEMHKTNILLDVKCTSNYVNKRANAESIKCPINTSLEDRTFENLNKGGKTYTKIKKIEFISVINSYSTLQLNLSKSFNHFHRYRSSK